MGRYIIILGQTIQFIEEIVYRITLKTNKNKEIIAFIKLLAMFSERSPLKNKNKNKQIIAIMKLLILFSERSPLKKNKNKNKSLHS